MEHLKTPFEIFLFCICTYDTKGGNFCLSGMFDSALSDLKVPVFNFANSVSQQS
jgi:hypothetical protein